MTSETKLDKRIAFACTVVGFVTAIFAKFAPFTTLGLMLVVMGILVWRITLFYVRKNAERRRVVAYWERPGARDDVHIVRDVMRS